MNPPKCCGVCANWKPAERSAPSTGYLGTELLGDCPLAFGGVTRYTEGSRCSAFVPIQFTVAPCLPWKRDHDGTWFVRSGDIELTVKYDIERERWEWHAGMAVEEWIECERGLRRTREGAMRAAEGHVVVVRKVMGNGG